MKSVATIAIATLLVGCSAFESRPEVSFEYQADADSFSVSCSRGEQPSQAEEILAIARMLMELFHPPTNGGMPDPERNTVAMATCLQIIGAEVRPSDSGN